MVCTQYSEWHWHFKNQRTSLKDVEWSGRYTTCVIPLKFEENSPAFAWGSSEDNQQHYQYCWSVVWIFTGNPYVCRELDSLQTPKHPVTELSLLFHPSHLSDLKPSPMGKCSSKVTVLTWLTGSRINHRKSSTHLQKRISRSDSGSGRNCGTNVLLHKVIISKDFTLKQVNKLFLIKHN